MMHMVKIKSHEKNRHIKSILMSSFGSSQQQHLFYWLEMRYKANSISHVLKVEGSVIRKKPVVDHLRGIAQHF